MAWGHQFKIRIGVVLAVGQEIMLVRQNKRPFWVLPGGTLELGEGIAEAAVREMMEETALAVELLCPLYLGDFIKRSVSAQEDEKIEQTLDIVFLARLSGQSQNASAAVMANDENLDAMGFYGLQALSGLEIKPQALKETLLRDWRKILTLAASGTNSDNTAQERWANGYTDDTICMSNAPVADMTADPTLHICSNLPVYLGKYH